MDTEVIKLDPREPDAELIRKAAAKVDDGELVAFATETVYGIACRVKGDSIDNLSTAKGRTPEKFYTVHIGRPEDIFKYVPNPGVIGSKLVSNFWPGPLTIVFELSNEDMQFQAGKFDKEVFELLYRDNSIGLRCPDNAVASILLSETKNPVVAPSANLTGQQPAVNAEQVTEQLEGKISMVLDSGPCEYKQSSTVVKISENGLNILRQGAYSEQQLREKAFFQVLFVCTGNTCRSPMAEGLFKKYWAEKIGCKVDQLEEMGYKILSVATFSMDGNPVSRESVVACQKRGIDISGHVSRAISEKLIAESDLVFTMGRSHRDMVLSIYPGASEKCFMLAVDRDVPDPIGQSQDVYDKCADMIENCIKNIVSELMI